MSGATKTSTSPISRVAELAVIESVLPQAPAGWPRSVEVATAYGGGRIGRRMMGPLAPVVFLRNRMTSLGRPCNGTRCLGGDECD